MTSLSQARSAVRRPKRFVHQSTAPSASIKSFYPHLKGHGGTLAFAAILSIIVAAATIAQPFLVQLTLERVGARHTAVGLVALLIAVVTASAGVEAVQYYALNKTAEEVVFDLRSTLVARVMRLPMSVYMTLRQGDITARATSDTTLVRAVVTSGAVELLGSGLIAIGAVVSMAIIDPLLTLIVVLILLAAITLSLLLARSVQVHSTAAQSSVGALSADLNRALSGLSTIRASNATSHEIDRLQAHAREAKSAGLRLARTSALVMPANRISTQAAFAVILAVGGWRVMEGTITVANLVAFIMMLFLLVNPLGQAVRAYTSIQTALGALTRIDALLAYDTEDAHAEEEVYLPADSLEIHFDHVHFSYPGKAPLLKGVTMNVRPGEFCAIVGESGAGKSTLFALLERFYELDAGRILIGHTDIAKVGRDAVRDRIAYVEQDCPILAGTIQENLLLGETKADDAECRKALEQVRLGHLISGGGSGLDSIVGEGGKLLSGGEQQRLAIARAMLTKKPVLLLDEPSSNLDEVNDALLRDALRNIQENRTILVITHRLSTVRDADHIYMLRDGQLYEGESEVGPGGPCGSLDLLE